MRGSEGPHCCPSHPRVIHSQIRLPQSSQPPRSIQNWEVWRQETEVGGGLCAPNPSQVLLPLRCPQATLTFFFLRLFYTSWWMVELIPNQRQTGIELC
jgi:hypothetical protein